MKNFVFATLSIIIIIILIVYSQRYDSERKQKIREHYLSDNYNTSDIENQESTLFVPEEASPLIINWERQEIESVGFIDYPSTIELRESKSPIYLQSERKYINTQYIFQQSGLKEIIESGKKYSKSELPEPLKKFVRVFIQTHFSSYGEYRKINSSLPPSEEKIKLFKLFLEKRENVTLPMQQNSVEILEWFPVETGKLNGMNYILISFKKQSTFNWEKQPIIIHKSYFFENYDRMHRVTFEYRVQDKLIYETDFQKMIESFRINNISN